MRKWSGAAALQIVPLRRPALVIPPLAQSFDCRFSLLMHLFQWRCCPDLVPGGTEGIRCAQL